MSLGGWKKSGPINRNNQVPSSKNKELGKGQGT